MDNTQSKNNKNQRKQFLFLLSTLAVICLFLTPSLLSLLLSGGAFVFFAIIAKIKASSKIECSFAVRIGLLLLAVSITNNGLNTFVSTWTPSRKVASIARTLHIETSSFLMTIGLLGSIASIYALYSICSWVLTLVLNQMKEKLPER